jgi:hypothetical protein
VLAKKQKGQGLVEFALILPLLLLLLLGIIEGARIIWAYITVQTAAREAARYAVSGRPYLDASLLQAYNTDPTKPDNVNSTSYKVCNGNQTVAEPDPYTTGAQPWICQSKHRVHAIEEVALNRGRTLFINDECTGQTEFYGACANQPGAFGVLVRGQVSSQTVTSTSVISLQVDHPGTQGLNVEISTFYNVKMIDPVLDAVMGGNYIRLQGRTVLQNEGIDAASGIVPPPPIDTPDPGVIATPGAGGPSYQIHSVSGYEVNSSDSLVVHLQGHPPTSYDIYLDDNQGNVFRICQNVTTTIQNETSPDPACNLSAVIPGKYDLFSTAAGTTGPRLAIAPQQVTVNAGAIPRIEVQGGNIWAARSETKVLLFTHQPISSPFTVELYDPGNSLRQTIATGVVLSGTTSATLDWAVPAAVSSCTKTSNTPCTIRSFDKDNLLVAQAEVFINQPSITLGAGNGPYAQGDTVFIYLTDHTPGKTYDVYIKGGAAGGYDDPLFIETTLPANPAGNTTVPLLWLIDAACGLNSGWQDGTFTVESRPAGSPSPADYIARNPNLQVETPNGAYITVDRSYTWPADSLIKINLFKHPKGQSNYYVNFGTNRVPTSDPSDNDTFATNDCNTAVLDYVIPLTTTNGVYPIRSYNNINTLKATRNVTVTQKAYIQVLQGSPVLPNATITITLGSHVPNSGYRVYYDNNLLSEVRTDSTGLVQFPYDLNLLPASSGPKLNLGQSFILHSESTTTPGIVATTTLALQAGDLAITNVQFPPNAAQLGLNNTVAVTLTVANSSPVTITGYFDTDYYFNPTPISPSYASGYNFPGNAKYWKNTVSPNATFTLTSTFTIKQYGPQKVYGFTDNSNIVYEGETTGQVANPNNLGNNTFIASCITGTRVTDNFGANYGQGAAIPNWTLQRFNDANNGYGTEVTGGQLYLNSDGSGNFVPNDSASGGELFFYRTTPVTTTAGFDVVVQVVTITNLAQWSKAGIEVRNSLAPTSARVLLGLTRNRTSYSPNNRWVLQPGYREAGQNTDWVGSAAGRDNMLANHSFSGFSSVWLRLERVAGTKTFNFYYAVAASQPTNWGTPFTSTTISTIGDQLYVGLYHSPYRDGTGSSNVGTARFDGFSFFPQPGTCPEPVPPANNFPPGLQICSTVLQNRSFEQTNANWVYSPSDGVSIASGQAANTGFNYMLAPSFNFTPYNPKFYQQFTMPSWVISTTTQFNLNFYVNINDLGSPQTTDKFYAVVATSSDPLGNPSTRVTTPTEIAVGVGTGNQWVPVNKSLPVINPATLESLAGQTLYLYLYDNGNSTGACSGLGGCTTRFLFDDVNLSPCTTQPIPQPITSRIKGNVTLHYVDGSIAKLDYVKVWAYAEGSNQVYETFTLPTGEFNFYSLPAIATGTKYYIFAQYNLVDPNDNTQIDTLAADTSIILKTSNTNDFPAVTALDLYTLAPPPGP